jgi:hypothetical protein
MISYDWQQRLKKDVTDFVENKIPAGDYDFEIIYNAYPERHDGEMPQEVITFVAKEMGKKIARNPDEYMDFLRYIHENKGGPGTHIFNTIMRKIVSRHPGKYDKFLIELITNMDDESEIKKAFDTIIYHLLKKHPDKYIDVLIDWIRKKPSDTILKNIFRILRNFINRNKDMSGQVIEKCKSLWNIESPAIIEGNALLLKKLYNIDKDHYKEIYEEFQNTYNPNFVEILANAVSEDSEVVRNNIARWEKSGNVRIKKAASQARKNLSKVRK